MELTLESIRTSLQPVAPNIPSDPEADLFAAGAIDSLKLLEVVMALEGAFDVLFLPDDLIAENFATLNSLAATIQNLRQRD
ncbi:MAG: acyl carrier protein [Desulfarculaceae bacterium]|jgi:acyl carrier protein